MAASPDRFLFERRASAAGYGRIAGVDEAGRGPLAGPVVAAAVIWPPGQAAGGITDSKKLTPARREALFDLIMQEALAVGIGQVEADEIDRINILQASLKAMAAAVSDLAPSPEYLLIDGCHKVPLALPQAAVVKGDFLSISIGAASIIAKVTRDRLMIDYHRIYPQYDFARHKGYPTAAHKAAICQHGCSPIHRRTFRGVREFCRPAE